MADVVTNRTPGIVLGVRLRERAPFTIALKSLGGSAAPAEQMMRRTDAR